MKLSQRKVVFFKATVNDGGAVAKGCAPLPQVRFFHRRSSILWASNARPIAVVVMPVTSMCCPHLHANSWTRLCDLYYLGVLVRWLSIFDSVDEFKPAILIRGDADSDGRQ